ncbi:O-antigen polymerase [Thermodesulfatator indicus DSM 15286]|uniref:O-antigen polymerase n=1 Tax=Thermodesulfatator indicus (strain DSM 15286 / JCM 11887 / CIR29812) TaxID=667014 RepID=F8AC16_THEID|nr:O-antigen ligase family protein [Thermodesulfatator indicus]AEH44571.1 O-antigen polymerase [Thermodesulfatator indicus DSM 15286]
MIIANDKDKSLEKFFLALIISLILFAFTIVLSKSINTIIMILIYLQVVIFSLFSSKLRKQVFSNIKQPLLYPFLFLVGISFFGVVYSEDYVEGFKRAKTLVNLILVYWLFSVLLDSCFLSNRRVKLIFFSFLFGLIVFDVIGFLSYFGIFIKDSTLIPFRPLGVHHIWVGNINSFGFYVATIFLIFYRLSLKFTEKFFLFSFILIGLVSIILSTSRTAWLGLLVTFMILLLVVFRKQKKILLIVFAVIFVFLISLYKFNNVVNQRVNLIFSDISKYQSGIVGTSIGSRFVMWKASFKMFMSNPFLGVGTGDYIIAAKEYVKSGKFPSLLARYNHPHNMFMFVLATNGLLGLTALLYIFYKILIYSKKLILSNNPLGYISLCACIHMIVSGFTENVLFIHMLLVTFSFIIGLCIRRTTLEC